MSWVNYDPAVVFMFWSAHSSFWGSVGFSWNRFREETTPTVLVLHHNTTFLVWGSLKVSTFRCLFARLRWHKRPIECDFLCKGDLTGNFQRDWNTENLLEQMGTLMFDLTETSQTIWSKEKKIDFNHLAFLCGAFTSTHFCRRLKLPGLSEYFDSYIHLRGLQWSGSRTLSSPPPAELLPVKVCTNRERDGDGGLSLSACVCARSSIFESICVFSGHSCRHRRRGKWGVCGSAGILRCGELQLKLKLWL